MEIAGIARAHDLAVIPHVGSPTAVGLAANLHWAAAAGCDSSSSTSIPTCRCATTLLRDPIFALSRMRGGMIAPPSGPGLGIDIDEATFAQLPYRRGSTYAEVFPDHEAGRPRAKA